MTKLTQYTKVWDLFNTCEMCITQSQFDESLKEWGKQVTDYSFTFNDSHPSTELFLQLLDRRVNLKPMEVVDVLH